MHASWTILDAVVELVRLPVSENPFHLTCCSTHHIHTEIKNPISLARVILDHSTQPMTLRRVPPNLLVSQGATDYAFEHGIPILPFDALVSPAAHDRWIRWKADLLEVERKSKQQMHAVESRSISEEHYRDVMRRRHTQALLRNNQTTCSNLWDTFQEKQGPSTARFLSSPLQKTNSIRMADSSSKFLQG